MVISGNTLYEQVFIVTFKIQHFISASWECAKFDLKEDVHISLGAVETDLKAVRFETDMLCVSCRPNLYFYVQELFFVKVVSHIGSLYEPTSETLELLQLLQSSDMEVRESLKKIGF